MVKNFIAIILTRLHQHLMRLNKGEITDSKDFIIQTQMPKR